MLDRRFVLLAAVGVFAGAVIVGRWATMRGGPAAAETTMTAERGAAVTPGEVWRIPVGSAPQRGPSTALVTLVVFTDLGPAGQRLERFSAGLEKQRHGEVRYALRVLSGGPTALASESLFAAHQKGRFFELREALGDRVAELDRAQVEAAAQRAGLDVAALRVDIQTGKPRRRADADMRLAVTFGVTAPSLFVNGEMVDGAASDEEIMRVVERQKARAQELLATGLDRARIYPELTRLGRAGVNRVAGPVTPPRREDPDAVYHIDIEGAPVRGPANALVTIVELGDFQCPFCLRAAPALRDILARHPDDVRLVWKNSPLSSHPEASPAAAAAMAAHAQGKFWQMHDELFAAQRELGRATYERLASQVGLDMARFRADIAGGRLVTAISMEAAAGSQLGAIGTPVFFVNGKKLRGFRSPDELVALVDRELEAARARVRDDHVARSALFDAITRDGARQPVFLRAPAGEPTPGRRGSTVQDLLPSQTALPPPPPRAP